MKLTYKQRLFGIILVIFAVFAVCVIVSERRQEKEYRTEALESKLDGYVQIIQSYISKENLSESD
ncbi:MAG TPA: two-component sensor histidine kinase, partial [Dysgonomonas sp.]|nr:two-component sensor histidine kinase [Dysgonomonas sp.]